VAFFTFLIVDFDSSASFFSAAFVGLLRLDKRDKRVHLYTGVIWHIIFGLYVEFAVSLFVFLAAQVNIQKQFDRIKRNVKFVSYFTYEMFLLHIPPFAYFGYLFDHLTKPITLLLFVITAFVAALLLNKINRAFNDFFQ
jgi:peptidoglycan/LPS O-acetylase OafA/YrhL